MAKNDIYLFLKKYYIENITVKLYNNNNCTC